jgi:hypothetical protein
MITSKFKIGVLVVVILATVLVVSLFSVSVKNEYYGINSLMLQPPYDKKDVDIIDIKEQKIASKLLLPDGLVAVVPGEQNFNLIYYKYTPDGVQKVKTIDLDIKIEKKENNEDRSPYTTGRAVIESQLVSWEGKLYPVIKQTVFHTNVNENLPEQPVNQEVKVRVFDLKSESIQSKFGANFPALTTLSSFHDKTSTEEPVKEYPFFRDADVPHSSSIGEDRYQMVGDSGTRPYTNLINGVFIYRILQNSIIATLYNPLDGKVIDELTIDREIPIKILNGNANGILFTKAKGDDKSIYKTLLHDNEDPTKVRKSIDGQYVAKISTTQDDRFQFTKIEYYSSFGIYAIISATSPDNTPSSGTRTYLYNMETRDIIMDVSGDYGTSSDPQSSNKEPRLINTMSPDGRKIIIGDIYINLDTQKIFVSDNSLAMEYVDDAGFVYGQLDNEGYVKIDTANDAVHFIDNAASIYTRPEYINSYNQAVYVLYKSDKAYLLIAKPSD